LGTAKVTGWLVGALVACALAAPQPAPAKTPGEVEVGTALRDATLHGLNGASRPLSAYRGKPLIINVWASWCGPCRAESASLERLAWSDSLPIIGISTDDDPRAAQAWLKSSNATLTHFIDRNRELENMLGADRIPLTVFLDGHGRVLRKVYGARQWDGPEARKLIDEVLRTRAGAAGAR
jgi:thiol-disulfide isomerase/thioredoxin